MFAGVQWVQVQVPISLSPARISLTSILEILSCYFGIVYIDWLLGNCEKMEEKVVF